MCVKLVKCIKKCDNKTVSIYSGCLTKKKENWSWKIEMTAIFVYGFFFEVACYLKNYYLILFVTTLADIFQSKSEVFLCTKRTNKQFWKGERCENANILWKSVLTQKCFSSNKIWRELKKYSPICNLNPIFDRPLAENVIRKRHYSSELFNMALYINSGKSCVELGQ